MRMNYVNENVLFVVLNDCVLSYFRIIWRKKNTYFPLVSIAMVNKQFERRYRATIWNVYQMQYCFCSYCFSILFVVAVVESLNLEIGSYLSTARNHVCMMCVVRFDRLAIMKRAQFHWLITWS